jgi:RHS repeat-associated protein
MKRVLHILAIIIISTTVQAQISGSTVTCINETKVYVGPTATTYSWSVNGGVFVGSSTSQLVKVKWTSPGKMRTLLVSTTTSGGGGERKRVRGLQSYFDVKSLQFYNNRLAVFSIYVTVNSYVSAGSITGDKSVCYYGNPSILSSTSSASGGGYTYQWQKSTSGTGSGFFTNISGAGSSTYDPPNGLTKGTWYRRRARSTQGCGSDVYTNIVYMAVQANTTGGTIGLSGSSMVCFNLDPGSFYNNTAPTGARKIIYQWQKSTTNASGGFSNVSGTNSLTYDPGKLTQTTWFKRKTTAQCGSVFSNVIKITVYGNIIAGSIGNAQTICYNGDPSALTSTAGATGGNGSFTYQWQYSNNRRSGWTDISGQTGLIFNPSNLTANKWYRRKVVTTCGTLFTNSIKITVYGNLSAGSIGSNQTICQGTIPAELTSTSYPIGGTGQYAYLWQQRSAGSSWASASGSNTAMTYNPASLTATTEFRRRASSCGETVYSNRITVTVYTRPTVTVSDLTIFSDNIFTLNGANPSGGYWSGNYISSNQFDPITSGSGTFSAIYNYSESVNGCSNSATANVFVQAIPVMNNSGSAKFSKGSSTTLSVNSGYLAYQWYKDDNSIAGGNANFLVVGEGGEYKCMISMANDNFTTPVMNIEIVSASLDKNYIQKTILLSEYATLTEADINNIREAVAYFDGLGRPTQTVFTGQSPNGYDIVQAIEYDVFGREAKKYLPYIKTSNTGTYLNNLTLNTSTDEYGGSAHDIFYNGESAINDSRPFSETIFDNSPLNRPTKQYGPGESWYTADKYVETKYEINTTAEAIKIWEIGNDMPASISTYAAGEVYKNINIDEEENQLQEFINKTGQTILKRVQAPAPDNWADTYYIYDDFGNLKFVLPPEASKQIISSPNATFLRNWAFQYKYDARQRMVEKQVPGADPVYMVYDKRDRLVLTQDGNQRSANQWTFTKYDVLNRPVSSGIYTNTDSIMRESMQNLVNSEMGNNTAWYESIGSVVHNYDNASFPPVADANDYFTVTYYDNYGVPGNWGMDYTNAQMRQTVNNASYSSPVSENLLVKGQVTASKVKKPDDDTWLESVIYYDDKYRVIQLVTNNHIGGSDRASSLYDFIGKVLKSELVHDNGTNTHTISQSFTYDHAGRLLTVTHKINTEPEITLSANEYNELGELTDKNLHTVDGTNFEQSVDYGYNIRGWLTKINDAGLSAGEGDYFGMELAYESGMSSITPTAMYNGNISAVKWKSGGSGDISNAYLYSYDEMNRIKDADYKNLTNTLAITALDMSVSNYDLNGNIMGLNRANANGTLIDQLSYTYNSGNQLSLVTDGGSAEEGFKDGNVGSDDYEYDANGNMTKDWNKDIQNNIIYNHLNLPTTIVMGSAGNKKIDYIYDAAGIKLAQIATNGSTVKRTDYVGGFIYEDNELQLIQHKEGRIIPGETTNDPFVYQYNLKDHLGNVRVSFTTVDEPAEEYLATMEVGTMGDMEENLFEFKNLDTRHNSNAYDHTDEFPQSVYTYSSRLNNATSMDIIGPAKILKVLAGDVVDLEVYATYTAYNGSNNATVSGNQLIGAIAAAFTPAGTSAEITRQILEQFNVMGAGAALVSGTPDAGTPAAYLNYILYDANFNYLDAGFEPVTSAAASGFIKVSFTSLPINQRGYMYIYVSNETMDDVNVHFDDLKITHHKSRILQMDDYYPFGLTFNSYTRPSAKKNDWKFQGQEHDDITGWDQFKWRNHQPDIGRFFNVDPLAEDYYYNSPYAFSENKVTSHVELEGLEAESIKEVMEGAKQYVQDISSADSYIEIGNGFQQMASEGIEVIIEAAESLGAFFKSIGEAADATGFINNVIIDKNSDGEYFPMNPNSKTTVVDGEFIDNLKSAASGTSKSKAVSLGRSEKRAVGAIDRFNSFFNSNYGSNGDTSIIEFGYGKEPMLIDGNTSGGVNVIRTPNKEDSTKYLNKQK